MLSIGDYAIHKRTGHAGKVFGYGLRMVDGVCLPTLKVRVMTRKSRGNGCCVEDVSSAWAEGCEEKTPSESYSHSTR